MKKRYIVRFCVIALAIGLILAGCDLFEAAGKENADPLILTGTSNGKPLMIIISQSNSSRAVLTPKGGEYYQILLDNVLVSKGTLSVSGSDWTFKPAQDSPNKSVATAVFSGGTLSSLTVPGTTISNGRASTAGSPSGNNNDDSFVAVTNITDVPTTGTPLTPLTLTGTVVPATATNKTIAWTVKSPTTGAIIIGNTLTAASAGTVVVTATVVNGAERGTNYTKDFSIAIGGIVPVTGITGVPLYGTVGGSVSLNGTVAPSNATNKTILWSLVPDGTTVTATINPPPAGTTGAAATPKLTTGGVGTVKVRATIANGKAQGTDYTQDFTVTIGFDFNAIAYGNGFVAGGDNGQMAYSSDGINWAEVANSPFANGDIIDIAYGENRFVAVGMGSEYVDDPDFPGYIVVPGFAYSSDGKTWTKVANSPFDAGEWIMGIAYGGGRFVAVGTGSEEFEYDGGESGDSYSGPAPKVAWSFDGITWYPVESPFDKEWGIIFEDFATIAYGGGKFVVGGYNGIAWSPDGVTWNKGNGINEPLPLVTAIGYGKDLFVAGVVTVPPGNVYNGKMAWSTDGETWQNATISGSGNYGILDIAYGGPTGQEIFVAVGLKFNANHEEPGMLWSSNGKNWTPVTATFSEHDYLINSIAFGNGCFIAGAYNGRYRSTNGKDWTMTWEDDGTSSGPGPGPEVPDEP